MAAATADEQNVGGIDLRLRDFFQGDVRNDPGPAFQELMRAILIRAQFVPGARHALGWRGLKQTVTSATEGWTARIDAHAGVFGVYFIGSEKKDGWVTGAFGLNYFPDADEETVERCCLRASAYTQQPHYLSLVRDFLLHEEMAPLFSIGTLFLALDERQQALYLGMQSLTAQRTIARNGVQLSCNGSTVWAIEPGGYDQDFPSLPYTTAFFEVLAASLSFNLEQVPEWLAEMRCPGMEIVYEDETVRRVTAPDIEDVFVGLGYGEGRFDDLFQNLSGGDRVTGGEMRWCGVNGIPEEYRHMRWWSAPCLKNSRTLNKHSLGIDERPPFIILSGFLGAGKTSFLQHFIEYQTQRSHFVAVIQNEIGAVGLDGKLLDYKVTEIDEGCVCCSLVGNLRRALHDILSSFQPDFIILETTGAANPLNLLDEIGDVEGLVRYDCTVTVVDAVNLDHSLSRFPIAADQIKAADLLLLNKCDLVNEKLLQEGYQRLRGLNPKAVIFMTERGDLNPSFIFDMEDSLVGKGQSLKAADPGLPSHRSHIHDGLRCKTLAITDRISREKFISFIGSLPPEVFRMKGIIEFSDSPQPMLFQYVAGRFELTVFPQPEVTDRFLTVIAQGEIPDLVENLFATVPK